MAPAAFVHRNRNTVCVMDSSSPLGVSLVDRLLRRGYTVHAAAYHHGERGVSSLKRLCGEIREGRLEVFEADPFDYRSMVAAMDGCAGLFYSFEPPRDQPYDEMMVEMEVRAAHNALEACAQVQSIERAVFTSSVTAVVCSENGKLAAENAVVDERQWSDPTICRTLKLWHALAKTLAEKTAWALAMDRGVDMVAVNPGLVTAPGDSVMGRDLKGGPEMYEDGVLASVDVDFLVNAHIAVYESPSTYGRYICFRDAVELDRCSPSCEKLKGIRHRIQNKKLSKVMEDYDEGRRVDGC